MRVKIKPLNGLKIRRPDTGTHLKEEGEMVKMDTFWKRRVADGDVEVVGETAKPVVEKPVETVEKKAAAPKIETKPVELPKQDDKKGAK